MQVVALCGLPGTGKSAVATPLARMLDAALLDKDAVRQALFVPRDIVFSERQDDLVCDVMLRATAFLAETRRREVVILDGRTWRKRSQRDALTAAVRAMERATLHLVECVCTPEIARWRLGRDLARGGHPASNRSAALYDKLTLDSEPILRPHLTLDTTSEPPEVLARKAAEWLRG
ncbi:MAG: AAA family ATPase [Planctomycetes bacterium]|nr:AAA family ATPase [Planctomycetota bacterium]